MVRAFFISLALHVVVLVLVGVDFPFSRAKPLESFQPIPVEIMTVAEETQAPEISTNPAPEKKELPDENEFKKVEKPSPAPQKETPTPSEGLDSKVEQWPDEADLPPVEEESVVEDEETEQLPPPQPEEKKNPEIKKEAPKPDVKKETPKPSKPPEPLKEEKPLKKEKPKKVKAKRPARRPLLPKSFGKKVHKKEKKTKKSDARRDFSSVLKDLKPADAASSGGHQGAAKLGPALTVSQIDVLRRHVGQFWNLPAGARNAESLIVRVRVWVTSDRRVERVQILDAASGGAADPFWQIAAESARRALLHPRCSPLPLPPNRYEDWKVFTMTFNPKEML